MAKRWLANKGIQVSHSNKPAKIDMPASGSEKEITNKQDDAAGYKEKKKKEKDVPKEPEILTEKIPFNMDRLILDQMKDMEDFMDEMRQKLKK